jgi:RNA polymerase sigma-70 factor, ECF subfamily
MPASCPNTPRVSNATPVRDRAACFEEVVLPHLGAAYALARSLTGSHADSDDIVQEACLRAFRGIFGFQGDNARAWMLTIVRHTAYSWIRKSRRLPQAVEDVESLAENVPLEEHACAPESSLESADASRLIREAMLSLCGDFRVALELRYIQGLTHRDIAAVTGVPIGTVMSRLHRARRQLAARVEKIAASKVPHPLNPAEE